ncbi:hypothetical protein ACQPZG_14310 [Streptomyces sp. CA-294286]|uniref:hypothetical protein n=1 Tax=Streptomyces sp. CA-294286 TaxID=3240070 RepID=UPI003D8D43E3
MDTNELNAPSRAPSRVRRPNTRSGVIHENTRHRNRFTVVGDHFSQHPDLSFLARGLGLYIQSLPDGVIIAIKFLSARFPESEARIATGLRELETAGYLSRDRVRLPNGQIVTRTTFRNHVEAEAGAAAPAVRQDRTPRPPREQAPARPSVRQPAPPRAPSVPPSPVDAPPQEQQAQPSGELPPLWAGFDDVPPQQQPGVPATPVPPQRPQARRPRLPLPTPRTFDPERDQAARDLLASLRVDDPRLTLADRDVHRLGPAVASWLERRVAPEAVRQELLKGLPERPDSPRALIAHRLTVNMPGALPPAPVVVRPDPLQDCDGCGRVFRAPGPGRCGDCRTGSGTAA